MPLQVGSSTPNFDAMAGNPLAKQIPWDTNPTYLAAWKQGRTGAQHALKPQLVIALVA
jgi:deoxyribodipyrimidine photolyase